MEVQIGSPAVRSHHISGVNESRRCYMRLSCYMAEYKAVDQSLPMFKRRADCCVYRHENVFDYSLLPQV